MAVFPVASSGIMLFSPLLFCAIWSKTTQAGTLFIAPEGKPDKTRTPSCSGVVWREDFVDMACEFRNHFFEFTLSDTTPDIMSDIFLTINAFDVDVDPQGKECGPEVDLVELNGKALKDPLTGSNQGVFANTYRLARAQLAESGVNTVNIRIDVDRCGWCMSVQSILISAIVGFEIKETNKDQTNMPFQRDYYKDEDLIFAEFSGKVDDKTLTPDTFFVSFRNAAGADDKVEGTLDLKTSTRVKFTPKNDLLPGVKYKVTAKAGEQGVTSKDGATLCKDKVWYFSTVPISILRKSLLLIRTVIVPACFRLATIRLQARHSNQKASAMQSRSR